MRGSSLAAAGLISIAIGGRAAAQCPDGSAPPCRGARAVARPLHDSNWLVLPFDNLARDPALDVVRDASVTLLYSAMSQWSDVLIVDDTRVADLMRGVPAGERLGQEAAFELARRVGAGKLVMGTMLKEGPRTRLQAAVFDVRAGRRLRSPSATTVGTDSLSAVFAALAQEVLGVPAPAGAAPADVGTRNIDALRAYVTGLEAERRFAADTAVLFYRRAVALDSTFGLAHYRLSQTLGNIPDEQPGAALRALQTAQRYAAGLPRRERAQVAAAIAAGRGDWRAACEISDRARAADSLDAWAWFARGQCRRQLLARNSVTFAARWNTYNQQLADWRRAAYLDSTYFAPVQSLVILLGGVRRECLVDGGDLTCPDSAYFEATMDVANDTLVLELHRPFVQGRAYHNTTQAVAARRRIAELSRDLVSRFLSANPGHIGAHVQMAAVSMRLNDLTRAESELAAARGAARLLGWRRQYYLSRFYLELWRLRPQLAAVFADSIYADATSSTQPQAGAILGRFGLDAAAIHRGNDSTIALRQAWLPVFAGVLPPDWDRLLERYANAGASANFPDQARPYSEAAVRHGDLIAFFMRRRRAPTDTAHADPIYRFQAWFALGDTSRARRALSESDSELGRRPAAARDDGAWLFNAEAHVLLADSAAALNRLRDWVNRWPSQLDLNFAVLMSERGVPTNNNSRAYGRTWLLYADLAMAAGSRDEARKGYQFVVDLWARGEAPVQPLVARARAALAQLGR